MVAQVTNSFEKAANANKRDALRCLDETSKLLLVAMVSQDTGYEVEATAENIKAAFQSFLYQRYSGMSVSCDDIVQRIESLASQKILSRGERLSAAHFTKRSVGAHLQDCIVC